MSRTSRLIERTRAMRAVFARCENAVGTLKVEPVTSEEGDGWEAYIDRPDPVGYGVSPWAAVVELARLLEGTR